MKRLAVAFALLVSLFLVGCGEAKKTGDKDKKVEPAKTAPADVKKEEPKK